MSILSKGPGRRAAPAYYCEALHGASEYNICVNSDMTVSCNCQDYDGLGHIGSLDTHTLEEIFRGATAQRFRKLLARGEFPLPLCQNCAELRQADRSAADHYLKNFSLPRRGLMVENTIHCNLRCRYCRRGDAATTRAKTRLSLEDIRKIAQLLATYRILGLTYHNLGEPFMSDSILEELTIIRRFNPSIQIWLSTNGLLLDRGDKREAALLLNHVIVSLDGSCQDQVVRYQIGGDFARAYGNMADLVRLRNSRGLREPTIEWKYVVFAWNDDRESVERACVLAKDAGIDLISFMPGGAPDPFASKRYFSDPYFQTLGLPSWRGREVDLRG